MGKQRQIFLCKRASILLLRYTERNSLSQISKKLSVSRSAVSRILKLHEETGAMIPRQRSGRSSKISKHTRQRMRRSVLADPFATATKLRQDIPELHNFSLRTVAEALNRSLGLPASKPRSKPLLIRLQLRKRLVFCNAVKNYSESDWNNIMWSDESTFQLLQDTRTFVLRPKGSDPNDSRYTKKTVKHPDSVMV